MHLAVKVVDGSFTAQIDGYRAHRTMRALGGMDIPAKTVNIKLRIS